ETINLTPYVGRVVFLAWHQQLMALAKAPRSGWLLDDVAVTISNVPPATIRITNNLAQTQFYLSGSVTRLGQGYGMTLTNAPPGTYTITFNAVPYYVTPASQTRTLA